MKTILLALVLSTQVAAADYTTFECITTDIGEYGFEATGSAQEYVCKNPDDYADFTVIDETQFKDIKVNQSLKIIFKDDDPINIELNQAYDINMNIL